MDDQYGPAAQPDDASAYTHKFENELSAHVGVFNSLPKDNWLHNVTLYGTFDYIWTGLPSAGDVQPAGTRMFLDDASHSVLVFGLAAPLAPLQSPS